MKDNMTLNGMDMELKDAQYIMIRINTYLYFHESREINILIQNEAGTRAFKTCLPFRKKKK